MFQTEKERADFLQQEQQCKVLFTSWNSKSFDFLTYSAISYLVNVLFSILSWYIEFPVY